MQCLFQKVANDIKYVLKKTLVLSSVFELSKNCFILFFVTLLLIRSTGYEMLKISYQFWFGKR